MTRLAVTALVLTACGQQSKPDNLQSRGHAAVYFMQGEMEEVDKALQEASLATDCEETALRRAATELGRASRVHDASVIIFGAYENGLWMAEDKEAVNALASRINRGAEELGRIYSAAGCDDEAFMRMLSQDLGDLTGIAFKNIGRAAPDNPCSARLPIAYRFHNAKTGTVSLAACMDEMEDCLGYRRMMGTTPSGSYFICEDTRK